MCVFSRPSAPPAPPPPEPVIVPPTPRLEDVSAPKQMQKAPARPGSRTDVLFTRRGKRGMVIQMGAATGTNIPGQ